MREMHWGPDTDWPCPDDLVEHIREIEEGWTLRKSWKARDEDEAERENRQDIGEMLARWKEHGITVKRTRQKRGLTQPS